MDFTYRGSFLEYIPHDKQGNTVTQQRIKCIFDLQNYIKKIVLKSLNDYIYSTHFIMSPV